MNETLLPDLSKKINYQFKDESLLREALTHRSAGKNNNERLEYLGDSILNFIIAAEVFNQYPDADEGDLSRLRAKFVNKDSLSEIAREYSLGDYITLGSGELKSGGYGRSSILADTLESIIGAVYCDGGFENSEALVLKLFSPGLNEPQDLQSLKDDKTRLQELLQSRKYALPVYTVVDVSGKSHQQRFRVECRVDELKFAIEGEGSSRRKAEQKAAGYALKQIGFSF